MTNPLAQGLTLTLRRLPAVLWAYAFNLALALLFSLRFHAQISDILNHSLYAQRLTSAFDLGPAIDTFIKLDQGPSAGNVGTVVAVALYFAIYFLLVPGTLFCYQTAAPARLGTLLQTGLLLFWRFVRITLLTLLTAAIILGPLFALQHVWATFLDNHVLGRPGFILRHVTLLAILLIASMLRLYFDLVEVHTVQLGQQLRTASFGSAAKPDRRVRRVRRTLRPAWRTLRLGFLSNWLYFLLLSGLGILAVVLAARFSLHSLAQPRVWPAFLVTQLALFVMLFTRFWQRGFETALAQANLIATPDAVPPRAQFHPTLYAATSATPHDAPDPIPNPEPASPSLDEPDPGVFHHDVVPPPH